MNMVKVNSTPNFLGVNFEGTEQDLSEFHFYIYQFCDFISNSVKPKVKNEFALTNMLFTIAYDARKASYRAAQNKSGKDSFNLTWPRVFALRALITIFFKRIMKKKDPLERFLEKISTDLYDCVDDLKNEQLTSFWAFGICRPARGVDKTVINHLGFDIYVNTLEINYACTPPGERFKFLLTLAVSFFGRGPFIDKVLNEMDEAARQNNCTYQELIFANSYYENWVW